MILEKIQPFIKDLEKDIYDYVDKEIPNFDGEIHITGITFSKLDNKKPYVSIFISLINKDFKDTQEVSYDGENMELETHMIEYTNPNSKKHIDAVIKDLEKITGKEVKLVEK